MRVLVTGANGFVGRNLVPELLSAGHEVVGMTRDADSYDPPEGVEVVEADLLEPDTLPDAFEDVDSVGSETPRADGTASGSVDAAYYLVHSLKTGGDFAERDRQAATNFSAAASAAGVDRVIYLGGMGETNGDLSEHLRSRQEIEAVLGRGSYDLTALRAAIIVGAGSISFQMVRQLVDKLPLMVAPKWVSTKCQPIAISDAVAYLVGVLEAPEAAGETYQIGGPDVLTYKEMLLRTAEIMGKKRLLLSVPVLTPTLSAYWVDLVTDVPKSVSHPLILGLKNPVVVTDDSIESVVDVDLTPFQTAVERALSGAGT